MVFIKYITNGNFLQAGNYKIVIFAIIVIFLTVIFYKLLPKYHGISDKIYCFCKLFLL